MNKTVFLSLFVSTIIIVGCNKNIDTGKFVTATCPIDVPEGLEESGKFTYGYMEVPELHENPTGKTIELAIAIHKCQGDSASHEPLVLVTGGPGMSDIDTFVPMLFGDMGGLFLNNRDIVIIELRGLKYSKPNLLCPEIDSLQLFLADKHLSTEHIIELYMDSMQSAYNRFEKEGVNLNAFNDYEIANDIVFVMENLDYEKFSVFGSSFGTLVAQHLLLNHPEHLVSASMNAVVDFNRGLMKMHSNSIQTLENIFQRCEANPELSKAYPDLKYRFLSTLKRLNESPDTLDIEYWGNKEMYKIPLDGNKLSVWLFTQMYKDGQIPSTLHKILSGDYSQIIQDPGLIFPLPEFSNGLTWSILLSEYSNFEDEDIAINNEYIDFVKGCGIMIFTPYFLNHAKEVWKVNDLNNKNISLVSEVPTLMLGGEMDHVCPPNYAIELSKNLNNSYLYTFPGIAHSPIDIGLCAIMMMKQFVDNPSKEPDSSCMQQFQSGFMLPE